MQLDFGRRAPPVRPTVDDTAAAEAEESKTCCSILRDRVRVFSEETFMQGIGQMLSDELPWVTRIVSDLIARTSLMLWDFLTGGGSKGGAMNSVPNFQFFV